MKKALKITVFIVLALTVSSLIPVTILYLSKEPGYYTNEEAIRRLKENKGELFGFIVLGDTHAGLIFNDSASLKLVQRINREERFKKLPIDFVAVAGDLTFRGSIWDYKTYNKIRSLIKFPVVSAMGNHDADKDGIVHFKKYIGNAEPAFADRNSYFIFVDNRIGDLTEEQFARLESELKKGSLYKHRFVIAHKTPLSLYQQSWFRPEISPWSYRFMKLCEKYNVDMVFAGHEHMFREGVYGGVRYFMTGGGGQLTQLPEWEGGYHHYLVVRIYGDYVDYEVRKVFPPFWEVITYYMWKEIFYLARGIIF